MRSALVILAGLQALACQEVGGAPAPLPSSSRHVWVYSKKDFVGQWEWVWGQGMKLDATFSADGTWVARERGGARVYLGRWWINTDNGDLRATEREQSLSSSWEYVVKWERGQGGRYSPDSKRGTLKSFKPVIDPTEYLTTVDVSFTRKGK